MAVGVTALAVAQFAPTDEGELNLSMMLELATIAAARGASLGVFPESSSYFTAEAGQSWLDAAQPLDGPFVQGVAQLAQHLRIHIVAGMLETVPGDASHAFNTIVAVAPTGQIVATYRKAHLYDAFGQRESEWIRAGDLVAPQTFAWAGFTVGLQTCYDIRFPEVTRHIVDAGADLVLVPAEWVRGPLKEQHWRTLVTARAIENTIYVAAADHAPPIGAGNSMIVDPMGVELATIGEETAVAVADVRPARVHEVRAINPALALRRFGVVPRS